ncbi:MAG TPA: hypothetical protein VF382_04320 [Actinomycetota bacterium]
MATFRVRGAKELLVLLTKHARARERRVKVAVREAAHKGASHVRRNVPVAFGELRSSVHVDSPTLGHSRIIIDAPHACAVEVGSRPHWVPIAPLIAWVKLRGFQGLSSPAQMKRLPGTTTGEHARSVAGQLAAAEQDDGSTPVNAPIQIAYMIQAAIAKRGTKPHWYARNSLPTLVDILDTRIRAALPDR